MKDSLKDRWLWSISFFVSCQGHIFIISWWLKSKLVTLDNFFKTNYLKSYDFWKNIQKQVTWRIMTFANEFFENSHWYSITINQQMWLFILNFENLNVLKILVIDYYLLVIDYQRVNLFGNDFVKTSCATQCFEKLFNTYLDWVFSWFLNHESWILILIILESWILKLETWFLKLCLTLDSLASSK